MENFVRKLMNTNPLPMSATFQINPKIILNLELTDKGYVVGWQDKRMPNNDNNLVMMFADLVFVRTSEPKPKTTNRIDDFINKLLPSKQVATIAPLGNTDIQKATIFLKHINVKGSITELMTVMTEVKWKAEELYWFNSGLKDAKTKMKLK